MKRKHFKLGLLFLFGLVFSAVKAQQAIPASGGMASGGGGSVSYSIGQMVYTANTGTNGSALQGVQQPYEISVLTGVNEASMDISLSVYPNPTTGILTLQLADNNLGDFYSALFNLEGKLLEKKPLQKSQTQLNLNVYPSGIYMLTIKQNNKRIKSFKIIKN